MEISVRDSKEFFSISVFSWKIPYGISVYFLLNFRGIQFSSKIPCEISVEFLRNSFILSVEIFSWNFRGTSMKFKRKIFRISIWNFYRKYLEIPRILRRFHLEFIEEFTEIKFHGNSSWSFRKISRNLQ